jgi:hypothetical protein
VAGVRIGWAGIGRTARAFPAGEAGDVYFITDILGDPVEMLEGNEYSIAAGVVELEVLAVCVSHRTHAGKPSQTVGRMHDEISRLERYGLVRFGHGIFIQCVAPLWSARANSVYMRHARAQMTLSL